MMHFSESNKSAVNNGVMKVKLALLGLVITTNTTLNVALLVLSYNKLATPFLHEEQRVENADFIITYVITGFMLISLLSALATYFITVKWGGINSQ